jgi:hypothetical protein
MALSAISKRSDRLFTSNETKHVNCTIDDGPVMAETRLVE